jgi:hypothetical protein
MTMGNSKKDRLLAEYKKNQRRKIITIVVGVLAAAGIVAWLVFGVDWENMGAGQESGHVHGDSCAH